ncbi:hypothetical protein [Nostoc sp.]
MAPRTPQASLSSPVSNFRFNFGSHCLPKAHLRSLSVSTANPVDDAADFMNRMSRGQIMAGGM